MKNLKRDFPLLATTGIAYLDSAATSQKPFAVLHAEQQFYCCTNANTHRAAYALARKATDAYEGARATVAQFIGTEPGNLIFVRGTTEAVNLVAHGYVTGNCPGKTVLFAEMNHHAGIVPFHLLGQKGVIRHDYIGTTDDGLLDLNEIEAKLKKGNVGLVCVVHVSNVLGTVNPIKQIADMAHAHGVPILVDGAQAAPHMPVDVTDLGVDFYGFSGHKMMGPTGIGALHIAPHMHHRMEPFQGGGEMITDVTVTASTYKKVPHLYEGGTQNIAGAVVMAEACRYLQAIGLEEIEQYVRELGQYAWGKLREIDGITMLPPGPDHGSSGSLVSFTFTPKLGIENDIIVKALDEAGVCVRSGRFCAQPTIERMGVMPNGAIRASFHIYNDTDDVDRLVGVVKDPKLVQELAKSHC
ncbi:MAG: cysteine desulfurase [Candidatus Magasanikbacteria bacterium]